VSVLREIRARGAFREPQFVDLGLAHVPFDTLTGEDSVEGPMLDAVSAGSSAAIVGARGGGKSSVLSALAALYDEKNGSIRHVLAALEVAAAAAIDSDATRLEAGYVRLGIEDWRDR